MLDCLFETQEETEQSEETVASEPAVTETETTAKTETVAVTTEDDDPYNAKDYATPEDFYYDHYDDFYDYDEAEEYWMEHCG